MATIQDKKQVIEINSIESNRYNNRLLNAILCVYAIVVVFKIFYSYTFFTESRSVALAITAIMACLSVIGIACVFKKLSNALKITWGLFVLFFGISYIIHKNGLEYICNTISFLGILTVLPYASLKYNFIKGLYFIFSIFVLIIAFFASKFFGGEGKININTNSSGFIMFVFEAVTIGYASTYKKGTIIRYLLYIIAFVTIIAQLKFGSRSSYIGTFVLIFYCLTKRFFNRLSDKKVKILTMFLCVFAIVFAHFYAVTLFNAVGKGNWIIFGKDIFTGRQTIWADAFERLKGNWIFGVGNTLVAEGSESYSYSLHNQMMGYLTCFGVIVVTLYSVVLSLSIINLKCCNESKYTIAFVLILSVIGFFETCIYSTINIGFTTLAMILLYFYDKKNCKQENINAKDNSLLLAGKSKA